MKNSVFESLKKAFNIQSDNAQATPKAQKKELEKELSAPTLTGVRNAWISDSMSDGLTPSRLAGIFKAANNGDDYDLLTLAQEIEEREPHYASVLSTRKLAIEALPITVEAASEDKKDQELADDISKLVKKPEFERLISDLLDGLGKGRSTVEQLWQTGDTFTPSWKWRDPRFFMIDRENPEILRLKEDGNEKGLELPLYKFVTHTPKLKAGLVTRSGLARLVAVSYMCKSYALSDWMAFLELFGLPIRMGRYGAGAKEEDIKILKKAVASIGSDAAAIVPESMRIEFIERATTANGDQVFSRIAEWLDKQISKAVLGQTATTEGTTGKLGNEDAQENVRQDLLKADAKQLARTLNEQVVKPYIHLNYGIPANGYPRIVLFVKDPENLQLLVNAVKDLVPVGLKVKQSEIRSKLSLSDPDDGDELFAAPLTNPALSGSQTNHTHRCPHCFTASKKVLNNKSQNDEIDDLVDDALQDWEPLLQPMRDPLQKLLSSAKTSEEFKARLGELLEGDNAMNPQELINSLAIQSFKAASQGNAG